MRALEFIRDYVTFKLPYDFSYQMKTPRNRNRGMAAAMTTAAPPSKANQMVFAKTLQELMIFEYAMMFIGLIFNILIIIFATVATFLVFSLLLSSVESKAFEFGVLRLVGLTKLGMVGMILTQAAMFVLPAIILAFILSFPMMFVIYNILLANDLGYSPSLVPTW